MAYTPLIETYREIDPVKDYLPYDEKYDKDLESEEAKANTFILSYYSAPEILKRDKDYADLNHSILDRVSQMADAISSKDLIRLRLLSHTGNLIQDLAKWNNGIKKATLLSKLITALMTGDSDNIYSKVYNGDTKLNDIDETSNYETLKGATYRGLGAILGKELNSTTSPDVVKHILNGTVAILSSGRSTSEVMKMIKDTNSDLYDKILLIKQSSGISDLSQLLKVELAIILGITSLIGISYSHLQDPSVPLPSRVGSGSKNGKSTSSVLNSLEKLNKLKEKARAALRREIKEKLGQEASDVSAPWYTHDDTIHVTTKWWWEWDEEKGDYVLKKKETLDAHHAGSEDDDNKIVYDTPNLIGKTIPQPKPSDGDRWTITDEQVLKYLIENGYISITDDEESSNSGSTQETPKKPEGDGVTEDEEGRAE